MPVDPDFKVSAADMRLLVVEDQRKLASFIKKGLTQAGYAVDVAESAGAAESLAAANRYNLNVAWYFFNRDCVNE